jgi:glutamyl-tRNA synthetase
MNKNPRSVYRFAPSPTGFLHVGGARTAIFNWLLAKKEGGKFLLRVEDTDSQRSTLEYVQQIISSLQWLGISWDGPPLFQSTRFKSHHQAAMNLIKMGKAYYCFCSKEKTETGNDKPDQKTYLYDGRCRNLSRDEVQQNFNRQLPAVVRIKLPAGITRFIDGVHGEITINNTELDDFVLLRSDGTPVYQLAVVVDDHDMGVTHVLRGDDHLSNTPKQIHIYQALNWNVPQFSHLPLILGPDRQRLSKRHGATSVEEFREKGIMPEALFNYLCLLGWSPGDDTEIMSREEIITRFSLDRINIANAVFDQQKLTWMNAKYLAGLSPSEIFEKINSHLSSAEKNEIENDRDSFLLLLGLLKPRSRTLLDFLEGCRFYFFDPADYEQTAVKKHFSVSGAADLLIQLSDVLNGSVSFRADQLEKNLRQFAEKQNMNAGQVIHPLRLALIGHSSSPGIFEVLEVLGRKKVIRRIGKAVDFIKAQSNKGTELQSRGRS